MHIISYRLPVRITSYCDLNVSWRTKEKIQMFLMSIVCSRIEDRGSRIEDRFYIRVSIFVVSRNFFIYLFICFSQNAKQPVSKTPLTSFQHGKEFGLTTGMSAPVREATQSPSKLRKNGSLSIKRFKNVVLGILVRGTLVQRRKAGFGLG